MEITARGTMELEQNFPSLGRFKEAVMAIKERRELVAIKYLEVEADRKTPGKYWIWMKIHSSLRTIARIEARIAGDEGSDFDLFDRVKERVVFMGHHGLKVGENVLPPLPLYIDQKTVGRDVNVHFGVKSKRHPMAVNYRFEILPLQ